MSRANAAVPAALLLAAFYSFVILGLPDGMLGVAWPSMSDTFDQPLGALGILMVGFTAGYLITSMTVGLVAPAMGYRRLFLVAAVAMLAGGGGFVLVPSWLLVIATATLLGAGAGWLDAGLNAYGATYFRPRDLNWLHAAYGVGATLGPVVMTPIVASEISWRWGYAVFSVVALVMLVAFWLIRRRWYDTGASAARARSQEAAAEPSGSPDSPDSRPTAPSGGTADRGSDSVRARLLIAGMVVTFFLYTGIEVVTGQWAFSLFTIGRGVAEEVAGPWISGYWGALTLGRVLFGWLSERVKAMTLLRLTIAGAGLGVLLIWLGKPPALGAVGLFIVGFSLAPMFPLLIGETPGRVGPERSDHAVGLQIAFANIGGVSLVGAVGVAVETLGLETIGVALAIAVVLFALSNELVARAARA